MRQRVTLVFLIVAVGVIDVVQILCTNAVAQAHRRLQVKAPATAPNVLSVPIDAVGFGAFHTLTLTPIPAHTPQTDGQ